MPKLNLLTSDEVPILIDFEIIKCSNLIRSVVNNLGFIDEVIPLLNVDHCTMQLILTWASQHKDDPLLLDNYEDTKMDKNEIPEWDKKFLEMSQKTLLDLTQAANYLHIPKLIEYCCKTIALLITGKTEAELRDTFGIYEVDNKEEVERSLSEKESLSRKIKNEALQGFETEESSLKRKSQEQ